MRLGSFVLRAAALLVLSLVAVVVQAEEGEFELRQLTEDNFRSSTSQGLWLVEHFSPKCSHCRAFAPTWTRLAEDKQYLERLSGFHMAQVNCIAQGDLCNANGIKFYPQLILYSDGHALPTYSGDRSYEDLSKYIDEQSTLYARGAQLGMSEDQGESAAGGLGPVRPNTDGVVLEVDAKGLEAAKQKGPVLVDFYAPWCGHCKKLRPTYDQLAQEVRGKLEVVAVNCDANPAVCRQHDVRSYPTIKLFHHGTKTPYTGPRSLEKMKEFALKAAGSVTLQPIKVEDFHDIVHNEEAFFLYLQNFDTTVGEVEAVRSVLEPLINSIPAYTSSDPLLYANLTIANPPPTSLLLAFSSSQTTPAGSLSFPASDNDLSRFVNLHRFPTLVELTSANYESIMKSDSRALVVLGALHHGEEGAKEREKFYEIARAWKRGGRPFDQPVWFAWVDGERWRSWVKQLYGIKKSQLPALVVIDPPNDEYYDVTIEGNPVTFDGAAAFSVLEGVYQHFLRPKKSETALEWGSRSAALQLIGSVEWAGDHPLMAVSSVILSVVIFVYLLQKCVSRDLSHLHGNYGNEKGPARLD